MYDKSMKGMVNKLVKKSVNGKLTYIAEMQNSRYIEKMDHLVSYIRSRMKEYYILIFRICKGLFRAWHASS